MQSRGRWLNITGKKIMLSTLHQRMTELANKSFLLHETAFQKQKKK